jgi:FKBP-type peptidyl-prolyl cis-trans isomerase
LYDEYKKVASRFVDQDLELIEKKFKAYKDKDMADIIDLVPETLSERSGKEKASYCIGLEAGNSIRMQFSDMDIQLLKTGFEDAIKRNRPRVTESEFQNIMNSVKQQVQAQQKAFVSQLAQKNRKQGEEYVKSNQRGRRRSGLLQEAP